MSKWWWQRRRAKTGRESTEIWQGLEKRETRNYTNATEGYEMKERSDLYVYSQRRRKARKTSRLRGEFVYCVTPRLKYLDHPIHDNVDAIIQWCPLLYTDASIYNQPLLVDHLWLLKHTGGHLNEFTPKRSRYIWWYKKTGLFMEPNNDKIKAWLYWNW